MGKELSIRTASAEDAAGLLEIYRPYVEHTAITFEYEVPTVGEFEERITNTLKRYPYLVAEKDHEMVGYAYVSPFKERAAYDWSVETSIYVRKEAKQQGIGRRLYDRLEQILRQQGILNANACIAYPQIEDEYLTKDSVRFHEKLGYEMVGTFHQCGYKFGRWYDMVWMEKYIGKSVYKGTAIGPVSVLKKKDSLVKRIHIDNTAEELKRLDAAKERTMTQLGQLYEKALQEVGEVNAAIFEVHQMMLEDDDYQDAIHSMIQNEEVNAEYAVAVTGDNFAEMFANMDDEYMQARSADVRDISNRLVRNLSGEEQIDWSTMEPSIIVADDLTPSETVQMDKSKILAFVTVHGSTNSHTAILARMMNIPALIGVPLELEKIHNGTRAIVDGREAVFYLDPEEEQLRQAEAAQQTEQRQRSLLADYKGRESVTKSGRKVNVYANIGSVSDVAYVLENDAEGIGLFRSEFLYLGRDSLPDETEQFNAYRQVLQMMAGKKVIIRTLDIGADKNVDYLGLGKEDNPAMGYRAIRICLEQPEIFKTQLRALLRAAKYGTLAIMYPMIISVEEVLDIQKIVAEVAKELEQEKLPYAIPEQGIMIETPAAVMMSEELAEHVDFFSIGTNDLTQYTLAIDRQNNRLDRFYNPHHEAVLRMIQMTVDGAHKHGKWVGICGELGADTTLTTRFVQMGIDELSVAPSMVLNVRSKICEME